MSQREDALERIDGRPVILSMSGGKDSTACALLLTEWGIEFEAVFMDTGWEHSSVYEYIDAVLEPRFGPIRRLKSAKYPGGMVDLVRGRKAFPSRLMRFCTQELKIYPFQAYLKTLEDEPVNVVGIRHEESKARANMPEWEHQKGLDCEVWRPLIKWTFEDVAEIHRRHNLAPASLYFDGAERVGCWPCIFSRKSEIANVAKIDPQRIALIDDLEQGLSASARARFAADGDFSDKTLEKAVDRIAYKSIENDVRWSEWKKRASIPVAAVFVERHSRAAALITQEQIDTEVGRMLKRTFFHGKSGQGAMTIEEIVEWSNGRGQLSFDLPQTDFGCFRWGFCDSGKGGDS